jgi:WD40 repeat protein
VLEMHVGERPWPNGVVAGSACDDYFAMARVPLPERLKDLLRRCLAADQEGRPHDFAEVETELLGIYEETSGKAYSRESPKAARDTADSLNNRALSFIDLGKPQEAEKCWEEALKITPNHAESLYNRGIHLWQNARIDDEETIRMLEASQEEERDYYIGKIYTARGDAQNAIKYLERAKKTIGETTGITGALAAARDLGKSGGQGGCIGTFGAAGIGDSDFLATFSADGKYALCGSESLRLIELNFGIRKFEFERPFCGNLSRFCSSCLSPDGKTIVLADNTNQIKILDTASGKCVRMLQGHTDSILSLCFSPDGKQILSSCCDGAGKLWDIDTGKCKGVFNQLGEEPHVSFSPDGKKLLSASPLNSIKLWDTTAGECLYTIACDSSDGSENITSLCWKPDGKCAVSGHNSGALRLWDIESRKCIRVFTGHRKAVNSVCISRDGKHLLSGSDDETVKLWDIAAGQCTRTFEGHESGVISVYLGPDGSSAVSISCDGQIKKWKLPSPVTVGMEISRVFSTLITMQQTERFTAIAGEIETLVQNKDIPSALSRLKELRGHKAFGDETVYFNLVRELSKYCISGNKIIDEHIIRLKCNTCGDFSVYGLKNMALTCAGKTIWLWNLNTGACIHTLEGHVGAVTSLSFSRNGKLILSGSADDTMRLWDTGSGICVRTIRCNQISGALGILLTRFSPDGKNIISADNKNVKLWDTNGNCIRTYESGSDSVLCFSPDGKLFLSALKSGNVSLFNIFESKSVMRFNVMGVFSACFSPDAGQILLGSADGTMRCYDIKTKLPTKKIGEQFSGAVVSICFSPNGKYVFSAKMDKTIKLWDLAANKCIRTFEYQYENPSRICLSPDGNILYALLPDNKSQNIGYIHIHNLEFSLEFPGWTDWDEAALPYLENFISLYKDGWTEDDFNILISELQNRGLGYIRPEGVGKKLKEMGRKNI